MDLLAALSWKKLGLRKVIALGLVLISFVMLFFPWITMSIKVMGEKYTMQDMLMLSGLAQNEMEEEMRESLEYMAEEYWEDYGIRMNVDKLMKVLRMILEGRISPIDCASASTTISGLMGDIIKAEGNDVDADEMFLVRQFEKTQKSIAAAAVGMWAIVVLLVTSMLFAVYSLLADKKYGLPAYAGVSVLVFIAFVVTINKLNDFSLLGGLFEGLTDDLEDMGVLGSSSLLSLKLFHLSAAPYIYVIAGITSAVMGNVPSLGKRVPVILASATKWKCMCGTNNDDKNQFCYNCGQKRQVENKCICGAEWYHGATFCVACGRKKNVIVDPVVDPSPDPVPAATPVPNQMPEKKDSPWQDMDDLI